MILLNQNRFFKTKIRWEKENGTSINSGGFKWGMRGVNFAE